MTVASFVGRHIWHTQAKPKPVDRDTTTSRESVLPAAHHRRSPLRWWRELGADIAEYRRVEFHETIDSGRPHSNDWYRPC